MERRAGVVIGGLLVAVGVGALVLQQAGFSFDDIGWPLYVIVPGIVLLVAAVAVGGPPAIGLAIAGSIVTTVGLILAVHEATNSYQTWAYAWALIAPGAVGVGLMIGGLIAGDGSAVRTGARMAVVGAALFAGFGLFFEGVIGLSGAPMVGFEVLFAVVLVGVGLVIIGGALLGGARRGPN